MIQPARLRRALAVIEERTDVHAEYDVSAGISSVYGECSCGWQGPDRIGKAAALFEAHGDVCGHVGLPPLADVPIVHR